MTHRLNLRFVKDNHRFVFMFCDGCTWRSQPWRPELPGFLEAAKDAYREHLGWST